MSWRVPRGGKLWEESKGAKNRDDFRALVESGAAHGILAFSGEQPVAWCSFGPRKSFPRLATIKALQRDWDEGTWSIVCFYILRGWRQKGVAGRLLEKATEQAFALGAKEVEGYPVVPWNPPTPVPAAFAWTGVPAIFKAAGYRELRRPGVSRPIFLRKPSPNRYIKQA